MAHAHPEAAGFVEAQVEVRVAYLFDVERVAAADGAGKIELNVEIHPLAELAKENKANAPQRNAAIVTPRPVALLTPQVGVGFEQAVVADLGIPAKGEGFEPLLGRGSRPPRRVRSLAPNLRG